MSCPILRRLLSPRHNILLQLLEKCKDSHTITDVSVLDFSYFMTYLSFPKAQSNAFDLPESTVSISLSHITNANEKTRRLETISQMDNNLICATDMAYCITRQITTFKYTSVSHCQILTVHIYAMNVMDDYEDMQLMCNLRQQKLISLRNRP